MLRREKGQSATEFIIVAPVIIMLIFGSFQFALLYRAKITLNYATFQAARAGALNNANRIMMENSLARHLAPLYTRSTTIGNNEGEIMWARDRVRQEIIDGFVWVNVLNPDAAAFGSSLALDIDGDKVIPNDNLMYRSQLTTSGLTIQDANLLQIRVSYCQPMIVPYIDRLLAILMTQANNATTCPECRGAFTATDTFERSCFNNRRFPIHAHSIVRMQSPASLDGITSTISPNAPTKDVTFNYLTNFWTLSASKQP